MYGNRSAENMSNFVAPITGLSGGAKRIFIELNFLFVTTPAVPFGDVGTD